MTAVVFALWLALPVMEVTGDSTCPTPGETRDQLVAIAPVHDGNAAARSAVHHVNVSSAGSSVHVELLSLDGQLVAERTLERTASCGEMAEAVAVIISAWEATFNTNLATPVAVPPETLRSSIVQEQDRKSASSRPASFDVGLAVLGSLAGGEAVFGGKLEGCLLPRGGSLGVHVALSATSTHTQSIATPAVAAQWMRAALSVGPTYRLRRKAAALDFHAGGALAVLHVQGSGLSSPSSDTSMQLGVTAGLRFIWVWHSAAGWLGTDIFTYPGQDRLTVGDVGEVGRLPRLEVQIAVGISAGQFR